MVVRQTGLRVLTGLLLLVCQQCFGDKGITCPEGFATLEGWKTGGRCFHFSEEPHTFEHCERAVCGPKGASLACIRGEDQFKLQAHLMEERKNRDDLTAVWIGLFNSAGSKEKPLWNWTNGCDNRYTNFVRGEPNDYCGGEDCVAVTGLGAKWIDASCRLRLPCMCEYPGNATDTFHHSATHLRDDTCYADCGDLTKWCSAWPFARLYDVNDDVCHWEETDGQKRGRGVSECETRVRDRADCGNYFSYSLGRCRCNPPTGVHAECKAKESDPQSDIFVLEDSGSRLVSHGQRCVYSTIVDDEYFTQLRPATTLWEKFRIYIRAAAIWHSIGIPSGLMVTYISFRMCFCLHNGDDSAWPTGTVKQGGLDGSYGRLLDPGDQDAGIHVNRWIFRAAVGSIMYGICLAALGATLAIHMAGVQTGFYAEFVEAFCMMISMLAVARAALMVHCRLAPWAKDIVGPWVLVIAVANFGMAGTSLCGVLIFSTLADRDYANICFAEYMFRWALLLAFPLQVLSGYSLYRCQAAAERYAGQATYVGGWALMLVWGTTGSGSSTWWAGYLDSVHEVYFLVAFAFVLAAGSQILAGSSLMIANRKVQAYLNGQEETAGGAEMPSQIGRPGNLSGTPPPGTEEF